MRDLGIGPIILGLAAYEFPHAWLGIRRWTWLNITNPRACSARDYSAPLRPLWMLEVFLRQVVDGSDAERVVVTP